MTGRATPSRARSAGRPYPIDRRALPTYRLLAVQMTVIAGLMAVLGFGFAGIDIPLVAATLVFGILVAFVLRRRGLDRLATAIEGMALVLASGMGVACLSVLVATAATPYADPWLAAIDARLLPFLSWPDLAVALGKHPVLTGIMCRVYSTLLWQPFLLIALLAATGRGDVAWRFLHAWLFALTACVAIFAITPAVTPYVHYGFVRADFPALTVDAGWHPAAIIARIRSGAIHNLAASDMTGLIAFPSFHTAAAVMLAWGFRRVPLIGAAFVMLDCVMLLTVPMIGSHYFIDVVAGVAVAALAIHVAQRRTAPTGFGASLSRARAAIVRRPATA